MDNETRIMNNKTKKIRDFTDLNAWSEGHKLVIAIYKESKKFPKDEKFGLISQIRRAVVSVTSNIAEGFSRKSKNDKLRFYVMAQSSLTEVQNQLIIAKDIQYLNNDSFNDLSDQSIKVHKILTGLIKSTGSLEA